MITSRKLLKNKIKYSIKIKTAFSSDIRVAMVMIWIYFHSWKIGFWIEIKNVNNKIQTSFVWNNTYN